MYSTPNASKNHQKPKVSLRLLQIAFQMSKKLTLKRDRQTDNFPGGLNENRVASRRNKPLIFASFGTPRSPYAITFTGYQRGKFF